MRYILNIVSRFFLTSYFIKLKLLFVKLCEVHIAEGSNISSGFRIFGSGKVVIGKDCWVGPDCCLYLAKYSHVNIGDNVDIAPSVKFVTGTHEIGSQERRAGHGTFGNISIGDGTWIGANVLILPNVHVGSGVIIAAGTVLKPGSYPCNSLVAGNPCTIKKSYD